jgi:hypothetical protein
MEQSAACISLGLGPRSECQGSSLRTYLGEMALNDFRLHFPAKAQPRLTVAPSPNLLSPIQRHDLAAIVASI